MTEHRDHKIRMTDAEEETALTLIANGCHFSVVASELKFKNRHKLYDYRHTFPDFESKVQRARREYCEQLEEDLLTIALDNPRNTRLAEVQGKHIMNVLKYRDPKVYGDKIDMNLVQTIDIGGSLERAERRVVEAGLTTNVVAITQAKKQD